MAWLGIDYSYTGNATDAWLTVLLMDVWHWTPLVALLCFAGLRAIPDAYYQAASIDGASKFAVFRYIQLPKLRGVLVIAVLLRFMDSFMIYTEPFVLTGGGPGNATTFLSQYLTQKAVGQFDLGPAAAFSLIYFLIILAAELHPLQLDAACGHGRQGERGGRPWLNADFKQAGDLPDRLPGVRHPAGVLDAEHELQDQRGNPLGLQPVATRFHAGPLPHHPHRRELVLGLHQLDDLRGHQHGDLGQRGPAGGLCVQRVTASSATSMCSSGC